MNKKTTGEGNAHVSAVPTVLNDPMRNRRVAFTASVRKAMGPTGPPSAAVVVKVIGTSWQHQRVGYPGMPSPAAISDRLRCRLLHDHSGLVLTAALHSRSEIVTARVPVPPYVPDRQHDTSHRGFTLSRTGRRP